MDNPCIANQFFLQDNNYVRLLQYQHLDTFLHQNKLQTTEVTCKAVTCTTLGQTEAWEGVC